jgi:hypothetical protein
MTVTDYPDWQTPQANADHIASTGAPLNALSRKLANNTNNIAVAGSTVVGTFTVTSICYELFVSVQNNGGNPGFLIVHMDWTDSATSLILLTRKFKIIAGATGSPHTVKISGPVHADTVTVTLESESDSTSVMAVQWQMIGTSRLYTRDTFRSVATHAGGFTLAGAKPEYGILINCSPSVAAGVTQLFALPCYSGRVFVAGHTTTGTSNMLVEINESVGSVFVLPNFPDVFRQHTDAFGDIGAFCSLPTAEMGVSLTNGGSVAQTLDLTITVEESAN